MKNWKQWVAAFGAAAMVAGGLGTASLAVYAAEDVTVMAESAEAVEAENTAENTAAVNDAADTEDETSAVDETAEQETAQEETIGDVEQSTAQEDTDTAETTTASETDEMTTGTESATEADADASITEMVSEDVTAVDTQILGSVDEAAVMDETDAGRFEMTLSVDVDNDALFDAYADRVLYAEDSDTSEEHGTARRNNLEALQQKIYDTIKSGATKVANGEQSSTKFTTTFTYSEYRAIYTLDCDLKDYVQEVIDALLADCPYEFYWFGSNIASDPKGYDFTWCLEAARDYSQSGNTGTYVVNTAKTSAATKAAARARTIAQNASGKDLYSALSYFKDQICELASYDTGAQNSTVSQKGRGPWAVINVFDGDESTKVVCEGYAKAFKYLCDLWNIKSHDADCYIVTGDIHNSDSLLGDHMWNVVHTAYGNFIVDVTNCDTGTVGYPDLLFMKEAGEWGNNWMGASGHTRNDHYGAGPMVHGTYNILIHYNYDQDTMDLYSDDDIAISQGYSYEECLEEFSKFTGWKTIDGKSYWYEKGVKQGTTGRGKEIYDPGTKAWYWLDANNGGAKAVSKDVYQESNGGKWVRYDADGHMIKGWQTTSAGTYYFDLTTGAMAKGKTTIDGVPCWFDDNTGIGKNLVWEQVNGQDYYWYENGKRQGYDPGDKSYRGKEIYDPAQNAWFWLDNNATGKKAVSKDVYQPYTYQGKDTIGKWVRYDATGRMIKGWQTTSKGTYYFDPTTGAMTKGSRTIDGKSYYFDEQTGIRR